MDKWFLEKVNTNKLVKKDGLLHDADTHDADTYYNSESHDKLLLLEDSSFWFKHRNRIIKAGITLNPPLDNRIIEVGGGNGYPAYYLSQNNFETAMFEPGFGGCKNAIKRGLNNVVCAEFNDNYIKQAVESIGLFDVLEHIEDEASFLTGLGNMLIGNGLLYITVPAYKKLWSTSDTGHFRRYSKKSLCEILKSCGFTVVYSTYFFRFLPIPIFMFRSIPYIFFKKREESGNEGQLKTSEFIVPACVDRLLNMILSKEIKRINKGKSISYGSSIFITAKKN